MGKIVPSASLKMTQSWREWLVGAAIQRCLIRLEKWDDRNLMKFNMEKCSPAPGEEQSKASVYAEGSSASHRFDRKELARSWWTPNWTSAPNVSLPQGGWEGSLSAVGRALTTGCCSSVSTGEPHLESCVQLRAPWRRDKDIEWETERDGTAQLREQSLDGKSQLEISICGNTWREGAKRMGPGAIQWSPVTGSEVMATLKHRRLPLNNFFCCEGDWADVAQGGCEIFLPGDIQKLSVHGPGQVSLGGHAWAGGWAMSPPDVTPNLNHFVVLTRIPYFVFL